MTYTPTSPSYSPAHGGRGRGRGRGGLRGRGRGGLVPTLGRLPATTTTQGQHYHHHQPTSVPKTWLGYTVMRIKQGLQHSISTGGSLAPVFEIFTGNQLQACLLAFLPTYLAINTGNVAVDMFLVTCAVTICMAIVTSGSNVIKAVINDNGMDQNDNTETVSITIEPQRVGKYGNVTPNIHHTALAWLISMRCQGQTKGSFRMAPYDSENGTSGWDDYDDGQSSSNPNIVPAFNILPRGQDPLEIEDDGSKFIVYFEQFEEAQQATNGPEKKDDQSTIKRDPPIVIRRLNPVESDPTDIAWMQQFLLKVTNMFLEAEKSKRTRCRFERQLNYDSWFNAQTLKTTRGLSSVALDKHQEELLHRDLETFHRDADFYKRMGLPYRRGYLFSGKPGTGKTSLVNAISSTFSRDLYYINLSLIKSDTSLQAAFTSVPSKSIIVFEDIDAQSSQVHSRERRAILRREDEERMRKLKRKMKDKVKRQKEQEKLIARRKKQKVAEMKQMRAERAKSRKEAGLDDDDESEFDENDVELSSDDEVFGMGGKGKKSDSESDSGPMFVSMGEDTAGTSSSGGFSLSALLNCLDGHMMNEDIIVIMTSNHPEVLDPALIRPGRIDLHLELGYCTRYQVNRMYSTIMNDPSATLSFPSPFPENIISPCDALRLMVLYRSMPEMIPLRLLERAYEMLSGKPTNVAMRARNPSMSTSLSPSPTLTASSAVSPVATTTPVPEKNVADEWFEPLKGPVVLESEETGLGIQMEDELEGLRHRFVSAEGVEP
ncbi:hypothetical protein HDU97_000007 [Phlyctochytrium planicorne]|nr:hypothetical protein HDU97_000007 [Phlyctochytrium planicorne]